MKVESLIGLVVTTMLFLSERPAIADTIGGEAKGSADQRIDDVFRGIEDFGKRINFDTKGAEIRLDPVLRQIVCRVGFQPFTLAALQKAMGLREDEIKDAVDKLKLMAMVKTEMRNGVRLVVPYSKEVAEVMRKWADDWCVGDDTCGVKK